MYLQNGFVKIANLFDLMLLIKSMSKRGRKPKLKKDVSIRKTFSLLPDAWKILKEVPFGMRSDVISKLILSTPFKDIISK